MALAYMIGIDEDALICDLAETYHIYGLEALPLELIATLAVGLRDSSRIRMKMAGIKGRPQEVLLAQAVDNLRLLVYSKTKDAEKGRNYPEPISITYFENSDKPKEEKSFDSGEDFEAAKARILKGCE